MAYVSYSRDLGHKNDLTDRNGHKTDSGTRSYGAHYSVPFGNWLLAWNYQYYRYHQAVAGQQEVYDYNGKSWSQDIGLTRLLYRDARRKTHLTLRLWQRKTQSFINDAEIDVQRRRTAGWSLALNHKEYLGRATLSAGVTYKRGTGWLHSLPAPEERYDEGTARMRLLTTDLSLNLPFNIGKQQFVYDTHLHTQWNQTLLTALDRIAIGGRYTVRGFDGEVTLSAERGWYWRNDLAWQYSPVGQRVGGWRHWIQRAAACRRIVILRSVCWRAFGEAAIFAYRRYYFRLQSELLILRFRVNNPNNHNPITIN